MSDMDRTPCPGCGELHDVADMHLGFERPDAWYAVEPSARAARVALTPDAAVIDGAHHFVRGVLEVPVRGEAEPFGWGVWVRVSAEDAARLGREADDARAAPCNGRMATQLAGFPQTLGLPLFVRPSGAGLRPLLEVMDPTHPLAREQLEGIAVERVLEHLSRYLHPGEPEPRGAPREATLADDGWQLDDAVARFQARDGIYWVPTEDDRRSIVAGELAKLSFEIEASDVAGAPERHRERMWVRVDHVAPAATGARYSGILANDPHVPGTTRAGMRVWFRPAHVVDVLRGGTRASESPGVLRCAGHGVSQTTYVCQHLVRGSGRGFHQADDPGNPRPDAWCDACEAVLLEEGDWSDRAEAAAGITVICAGCYDAAEARNRAR